MSRLTAMRKDRMQSDAQLRSRVRQLLERFNHLVSTRNPQVLAEFVPGDDVLLVGSEAGDVIHLYKHLSSNAIQVWLIGGWGIDALLGEQTRPHKDLDVIMLLDDVPGMYETLHRDGYRLKELWSENLWAIDSHGNKIATAFVLQDSHRRQLDAHAMRLDDRGTGLPAWEAPEGFVFSSQDLAGLGVISGFAVRCITPKKQVLCHAGYALVTKVECGTHPIKSNTPHPEFTDVACLLG
jgi:lincosamide nucleotidyltransferase A/C/D/E